MEKEELIDAIFTKNNEELSKFIKKNFYEIKDNDYHSYINKIYLLKQMDKNVLDYANNRMNAYGNHFSTVKDFSIILTVLSTLTSYYLTGLKEVTPFIMFVVFGLLFAGVIKEYTKTRSIWINFMFFRDILKSIK
ncbi:MAG: hypothetical protein ABS916_03585 [Carnobacterium sp.]|uniref:hypothetical protein n=1 Tax=Carnobacterium sp. TaxID=48221 RepID=UPI003314758B